MVAAKMSNKIAKIVWAILVVLTAICASPLIVLMGERDTAIHPYNITGTECTVLAEFHDTNYFSIFTGLLFILFFTGVIVLTILCCLIGKQIRIHAKKWNNDAPKMSSCQNSRFEHSSGISESNEPPNEQSATIAGKK